MDCLNQYSSLYRLFQDAFRIKLREQFHDLLPDIKSREKDHLDIAIKLFQLCIKLVSSHSGHSDIQQDKIIVARLVI